MTGIGIPFLINKITKISDKYGKPEEVVNRQGCYIISVEPGRSQTVC